MKSGINHTAGVIITGNNCINNLGVARSMGRHNIPVILLSSHRDDMVRYSRYVKKKLSYPDVEESESQFIDFLLNLGREIDEKYVIVPTSDAEVLALAKYREELQHYYLVPVPDFDIVKKLVNKREFYQLLEDMSIPHPKTYFPESLSELKSAGREIGYPYIIKPSYMHLFTEAFRSKCFYVNSKEELNQAVHKLEGRDIDVVIQEIIPGDGLFSLATYLNRDCRPLAVCGYDKIRQYPADFGIGSLWKSAWREGPINSAVDVLQKIGYYGLAEPEFKKDPRDGVYKFLEINARSVMQNSLPAKCGADIIYIAYLDTVGRYDETEVSPENGILWIYEVYDILSCFNYIARGKSSIKDIVKSFRGKKVFATAACDDLKPFVASLLNTACSGLKRLFR